MTASAQLTAAFRFHMRNNRPAFYYAQGYNGRNAWPEKAHGIAREALARARADVASGKARYPAPVRVTWQEECEGLRLVGRVAAECGGYRNGYFSNDGGWYTDPHGDVFKDDTGLCYGVVYQLAARNGHARFVAGYQFGGVDGGPTLEFKRIYVAERAESEWLRHDAADCPAVRKACHAADAMAQKAAESEREYQTAWRAGSDYEQEGQTIAEARAELLELLAERKRAIRGAELDSGYALEVPAICRMIKRQVSSLLETIAEARTKRADLANGDADGLSFWTGDKRLQDAFCDGAGLDSFPA